MINYTIIKYGDTSYGHLMALEQFIEYIEDIQMFGVNIRTHEIYIFSLHSMK